MLFGLNAGRHFVFCHFCSIFKKGLSFAHLWWIIEDLRGLENSGGLF